MVIMAAKLTYERPFWVAKRKFREFMREGLKAALKFWYDNFLPLHFKPASKERYHHQTRSSKYLTRKIRAARRGFVLFGGMVDNVYSGDMMDMLLTSATLQAFPTRAIIKMTGPRYMTMRVFTGDRNAGIRYGKNKSQVISSSAGQQPDKVQEITTVIPEELRVMNQVLADSVGRSMRTFRAQHVFKTKAA